MAPLAERAGLVQELSGEAEVSDEQKQEFPVPSQAIELRSRVQGLLGDVDPDQEITTEEEASAVNDALARFNEVSKRAESARVAIVKPLNDHVKFINRVMREPLEALEPVEKKLRKNLAAYLAEKRRQQEEEERRRREEWERQQEEERQRLAREAEEKAAAERKARTLAFLEGETEKIDAEPEEVVDAVPVPDLPPLPVAPPPRVQTLSGSARGTTVWKYELTDIRELCAAVAAGEAPPEFVQLNAGEVNRAVKRKDDPLRECPGIRVFEEDSVTIR